MSIFNGFTRRKFLQGIATGAAAASSSQLLTPRSALAATSVPPGKKLFNDWEGAPEYADALGRNISKAISGELSSQQALDEAADEWVRISQKLGLDSQQRQYKNFIDGARSLGYKI